jgi:rfaE bifunctional protein nucleotidyltransferase chain/domain
MGKIINTNELSDLSKLKKSGRKIILVGGCFDILHEGHIQFLARSKKLGDILVVMLESDQRVRSLKGIDRPINSQNSRAKILSGLPFVDYIIKLEDMSGKQDYEILVKKIEPDIIAVTEGAQVYAWEKAYMTQTGGKIVPVIERIENFSTTQIARKMRL